MYKFCSVLRLDENYLRFRAGFLNHLVNTFLLKIYNDVLQDIVVSVRMYCPSQMVITDALIKDLFDL